MALFITGTDTNVGKTLCSAWLCHHTDAAYWKPVQTGTEEGRDSETVMQLAKVVTYPEAYLFKAPLSPHEAAAREGQTIELAKLTLPTPHSHLIIEGAGGVLVPLNREQRIIDLIDQLRIPVIVVARGTLGTINHTCLTLEALYHRAITVAGVIISGETTVENMQAIAYYGNTTILAHLPPLKECSFDVLQHLPLPAPLALCLKEHLHAFAC